jgi:hypothetical protein
MTYVSICKPTSLPQRHLSRKAKSRQLHLPRESPTTFTHANTSRKHFPASLEVLILDGDTRVTDQSGVKYSPSRQILDTD